jgi:hypothetical protein
MLLIFEIIHAQWVLYSNVLYEMIYPLEVGVTNTFR